MLKRLSTHLAVMLLYLSFGLSLGCYYTATYFGRGGWPLPSCEAVSGALLYYFSVMNTTTETQAVHWVTVFVVAGYLWIASLWVVSNRLAGTVPARPNHVRRLGRGHDRFTALGLSVAVATIPVSLPIPFMVRWMGGTRDGFHWSRFIAVCLRHGWVNAPIWLNYVYCALAGTAFIAQIVLLRRRWRINLKRTLITLAVAFGMLLVISIGAGLLLSYPLRAVFER